MGCAVLTPEQVKTRENLRKLKSFFNGNVIRDIDNKSRSIGKKIYGGTKEAFGEKMFEEIVWKSTYKPADEGFATFTDGDYRRIANEIEKESKRLRNPKLNILERFGFVKRGVMGKFAVTRWMNKHINLSTNYERTKFSMYLSSNTAISNHLRAELINKDPSLKNKMPGVKSASSLDKFERKLIFELQNLNSLKGEAKESKRQEIEEIRTEISKVLSTDGGKVLTEMVDWLETTPDKNGVRLKEDGTRYSFNIEKAGMDARALLDNMGGVLINGLKNHKNAIKISFNNLPTNRLKKYFKSIDEHIESIENGVKGGDYFPHYITEGLMTIEKVMNKIDSAESLEQKNDFLGDLESTFSSVRQSIGSTPQSAKDRSRFEYDNWIKNPLTVLRKYSMDAISFNRTNYLKSIYLEGMRQLPKEAESARGLNDYINDVFTLAGHGYQDRPNWVNKTVRVLTGYEFFSKIGFGVATAARNTMSGLYYIQSVGNRSFTNYLRDWNKEGAEHKNVRDVIRRVEEEQGFIFEDLSNPLFTEGLLPTEGLRNDIRDMDIIIDPQSGQPSLQYKTDKGWQTFDSMLSRATGAGAIFQKVTENFLRKHMFRYSFKQKYNELIDGGRQKSKAEIDAKVYALDIVNKYAFEYSASQKAPIVGGTGKNLGALGQVAFQFMHFPMSFLQLQSEILRNSKDALMSKQWNNPDMYIPLKFAGLYLFTQLASGIGNVDFNRLMENDTVDRIKDLKDAVSGKEDIKGRGYMGPAVGDLFFLATMKDWIDLPDNQITDLIVGYNNAYKLTDEQKGMRLLSTFNVEMAKVPRNWKALQNGTIWNVMMHEFGLYPSSETREMRKKHPLKKLFPEQKRGKESFKKKDAFDNGVELQKLYRAMGI
jgi:hypothetical protein